MQQPNKSGKLEILAPAGSMDALIAAVRCGADAVYLGQKNFSARKNSQNFDEESLTQAVQYAHRCGVKIHQALNIVVFDQELDALRECIRTAVRAGVDAMIVQDWGVAALVREYAPDMALHASTQMAIHSPAGVRLAERLGFSRVVLARELSRKEIEEIVHSTSLETEIFVHGAHCMSVSGQCYLSAAIGGKSGNRGQCAQPCRLPFTAGCSGCGKKSFGENVLSLKDMDLTLYLPEIARMGVTSVKIEGRMKRPEYVAASVTACKQALNGETPDLDTLQAVFSRSGFTDGYFAGQRTREMFGFRTREDVTAAADVFTRLRGLYHKENPLVPVSLSFRMCSGEAVSLVLSDGEHTVSVNGEVPQQAEEGMRPADREYIVRQLEKLGGTPYYLPDRDALSVTLDDGLMIRASQLNAIRREAVQKLDELRQQPSGRWNEASDFVLHPETKQKRTVPDRPAVWCKCAEPEQVEAAAKIADKIILPAAQLVRLAESGQLSDNGRFAGMAGRMIPVLPRLTYREEECISMLQKLKSLGFEELYCESNAHIQLGKEAGFTLIGGPYLNLSNSVALTEARKLGLSAAVLSPEGKLAQLSAVVRKSNIPCGLYAYGRMALMALRNCPVRAQIGCKQCGRNGFLTDRMQTRFPVRCDRKEDILSGENAVSYLLNSLPLSMSDKQRELAGFDFVLLDFTIESPREMAQILDCWQQERPLAEYTRGLYMRGVM
ncbi:MAG TPA: U32 family peptidase [Candidatus Faecivivens stercoripullorum]|uniref:U32 family peptidase n=1 Tax=Candidatus Faecivivens stercoripullorum TaxID=2840805 RepID=A0A9D1KQT8_9FIRM|nr:U32 family peptidase [Candidatus Faecivivens stercoripullorum]